MDGGWLRGKNTIEGILDEMEGRGDAGGKDTGGFDSVLVMNLGVMSVRERFGYCDCQICEVVCVKVSRICRVEVDVCVSGSSAVCVRSCRQLGRVVKALAC